MQKYEKQQPLPTFRPMSFVAKRSPISATPELLFYFNMRSMASITTLPRPSCLRVESLQELGRRQSKDVANTTNSRC